MTQRKPDEYMFFAVNMLIFYVFPCTSLFGTYTVHAKKEEPLVFTF